MQSILKEQFKLSKECNIPPSESEIMPDFERQIHIGFLMEDKQKEQENLEKQISK